MGHLAEKIFFYSLLASSLMRINHIDAFLKPKVFLPLPATSYHSYRVYESLFSGDTQNIFNRDETEVKLDEKQDRLSKIGVLLCNLGGPENIADVEGFLFNLFADPDIIRLPGPLGFLQKPLAKFVSKRRAPKSISAYTSIGGGSPIARWTKAQASALEVELSKRGIKNARCYIAMRYWHPFTAEAIEEIERDGIEKLVILPLYPQYSISTSGSSLRAVMDEIENNSYFQLQLMHTVIPSWHDREGYVKAVAKLIANEVLKFTDEQLQEGVTVLFSAHGVPQAYIAEGDPYQSQIEGCTKLIENEARNILSDSLSVEFQLSYQSRVGPIEWLRPYTEDAILNIGSSGRKSLVVVPISFVSEHIETLEEIDIEYRELAVECGIENWRRVPALNTDRGFISELSAMVVDALHAPILTVYEAYYNNGIRMGGLKSRNRDSDLSSDRFDGGRGGGINAEQKKSVRKVSSTTCQNFTSNAERIAAMSYLMLMLDGCGREILLNSQLPVLKCFML